MSYILQPDWSLLLLVNIKDNSHRKQSQLIGNIQDGLHCKQSMLLVNIQDNSHRKQSQLIGNIQDGYKQSMLLLVNNRIVYTVNETAYRKHHFTASCL